MAKTRAFGLSNIIDGNDNIPANTYFVGYVQYKILLTYIIIMTKKYILYLCMSIDTDGQQSFQNVTIKQ